MSPRTKEQFEEIREEKKQLIRDKALQLFAAKGYHVTSISMIAEEAKISKGLMYNYYASKEALLKDVMKIGLNKLIDSVDTDHDGKLTSEELSSMLRKNMKFIKEERNFWMLFVSILTQPSVLELVKEEIELIYTSFMKMFSEYFVREGYEDPETEAWILGSLLDGIALHFLFNPVEYPIEKVMNRIIKLYGK